MNCKLAFLTLTFSLVTLAHAMAEGTFVGKGNAHCPQFDATRNWQDWFAGKYDQEDHAIAHPASIRFNYLTEPLGPFKPNTCYTLNYEKGVWYTSLNDGNGPRGASGADPVKLEMNLAGHKFIFNKSGQVMDKEHRVVGTLKCGVGPDC